MQFDVLEDSFECDTLREVSVTVKSQSLFV